MGPRPIINLRNAGACRVRQATKNPMAGLLIYQELGSGARDLPFMTGQMLPDPASAGRGLYGNIPDLCNAHDIVCKAEK
jgi:hypothetical protein